jgi:hypothetical protein
MGNKRPWKGKPSPERRLAIWVLLILLYSLVKIGNHNYKRPYKMFSKKASVNTDNAFFDLFNVLLLNLYILSTSVRWLFYQQFAEGCTVALKNIEIAD